MGRRNYPEDDGFYYDYEDTGARGNTRRRRKKKKRRKWLFVLEILLLLIAAAGLFAGVQLYRMDRVKLGDILVNNLSLSGDYRNIALFGVDSREGNLESGTNSDTIIICSINKKTKDIRLVSVYRDTYLDNTDGSYRKATECYSVGGARQSVNMLNTNLDLDIEDFVTVDFSAIVEMVDLIGGIDMEITDEELTWLNGYCEENSRVTGVSYEPLTSSGYQHLDGIQALAYCRIRYTEGWDYKRTDRQREVLGKILEKAKAQPLKVVSIANEMIPHIATSLTTTELISLATGIMSYNIADSTGFPFDRQTADIAAGDCVIPVNLAANVSQLHSYLFGEENYTPSDAVQQISSRIISDTGIQ